MRKPLRTLSVLVLLASLPPPTTAQTGKIETLGALQNVAVPKSIRNLLEAKGYRILVDQNAIAGEIWFRKDIPAQPKKETADVVYDHFVAPPTIADRWSRQASTRCATRSCPMMGTISGPRPAAISC